MSAAGLAPPRRRGLSLGDTYLRGHSWLLLGYALAGKGFAYLGFAPLYVGEMILALGLAVALGSRALLRIPRTTTVTWLLLLSAWCAARLASDFPIHGIDALRDSVVWSYAFFAFLFAGLLNSKPQRLAWLLARYERFGKLFVVLIPVIWLVRVVFEGSLPRAPGSDVPILFPKPGDILVHLAGFAAYLLSGAGGSRLSLVWLLLLGPGAALAAVRTRGGLVAFCAALGLVALQRRLARRVWLGGLALVSALALLLASNVQISVSDRTLSARQFVANVVSTFGEVQADELDGPRRWRLAWWSEIIDYTVFGPHFWLGKGFGVNLATDDGFDVDWKRDLRSPHNSHLTLLARAGVPGFVLWCLLQLSWLREMARRHRAARQSGQRAWSRLFVFLIAYWLAFVVNAAFDVCLEGPMMGIWFWTLFGTGIAAARIHRRHPEVLEPQGAPT